MTALELKIIEYLRKHVDQLKKYDATCQEIANEYLAKAAIQTEKYWKEDFENTAKFHLGQQQHEYDFLNNWKNDISMAMYGRIYHEWHPAQAGRYKGTGHGAYITTELTTEEQEIVNKVFNGLVKHGYLRLSKSGKMAKMVK